MLNRSKIMGGLNSTTQSEHNHKKLCKNCMSAKIAQICKLVKVAQKLHSARSQFSGGTKYFADWLTSNLTEQKYPQIKHIQQQHNWCVTQFSLCCQHSTQPHTHTQLITGVWSRPAGRQRTVTYHNCYQSPSQHVCCNAGAVSQLAV